MSPRFDLDGDLFGDNTLRSDLDRILARPPMARPAAAVAKPANLDQRAVDVSSIEGDGFDWEPDIDEVHTLAAGNAAASVAWLAKARQDKQGRARRHAAAWVATFVIAAIVLAATAYVLNDWTPDLSAFKQVAANWSPAK